MNPDAGGSNSLRVFRDAIPFLKKKDKDWTVSISKDEICYKMNYAKRGNAFIFNHIDYDPKLKAEYKGEIERRDGTEHDCQKLRQTFELLGFEVNVYEDLKVKKIESKLDKIRRMDYKDCDCLILAVLSHGRADKVLAWDDWYSMDVFIEKFTPDNCPSLLAKPKILILQLCQGTRVDSGCEVRVQTDGNDEKGKGELVQTDGQEKKEYIETYRLPLYADFLLACSTTRGYYSYRSKENGSFYIEVLCNELQLHAAEKDILTILTYVNRRIAIEFESYNVKKWQWHKKKQMPSFTSMLTRLLFFHPK